MRFQATGESEARIDIVNLDWIEIDYQKKADPLEAQEAFQVPKEAVQLTGFEGPPTIFEISSPSEISRLVFLADPQEHLVLQGESDQRYIFVSQNGYFQPDQIKPLTTEPDLRVNPGAAYIAIGSPELLSPLEPLLETRNEQGLSTLRVPTEAIYDQFNGGIAEPQAIQAFLRYAVENWEIPPEYILLVGDTSYDLLWLPNPHRRV